MSGARALASARRRRAGPSENDSRSRQPPPPPAPVSSSSGSALNEDPRPIPGKKLNPTMMLLNHDKVLNNFQEVMSSLNEKVENQEALINERFNNLTLDDGNIEFFKEKISGLEKQLSEIKKHILKVQTFAMETNLQFMELKKSMNQSVINTQEQLDSSQAISDILLENNDVSN